jgi:hypothetical protein
MDPNVYKGFRMHMAPLPPHIPIPEPEAQDDESTPKASWNIHKVAPALPNPRDMMQQDTAMSSSEASKSMLWMSRRDQQPFMYPETIWQDNET